MMQSSGLSGCPPTPLPEVQTATVSRFHVFLLGIHTVVTWLPVMHVAAFNLNGAFVVKIKLGRKKLNR